MQTAIHPGARPTVVRPRCAGRQVQRATRGLLSLTHPNKELFYRQRALLRGAVPAGFPSPADDYVEQHLSLDEHLIQHRESTFFMRVAGAVSYTHLRAHE